MSDWGGRRSGAGRPKGSRSVEHRAADETMPIRVSRANARLLKLIDHALDVDWSNERVIEQVARLIHAHRTDSV